MQLEVLRENSPVWMSDEAIATLNKGYLQPEETPNQMYERLAKTAASYYPFGIKDVSSLELESCFYLALINGWLSPATPVAANFGATGNGLPVSCQGISVGNSIYNIFSSIKEAALLSKHGGGLGVDLSNLKGITTANDWARFFDLTASVVSQNQTRRGAIAIYLDIEHPDIWNFLNAKDLLHGDSRQKLDCNIAVKISRAFMDRVRSLDSEALELFGKIIELRMKFGSPYIQFVDNCWDADPIWYKEQNLKSGASQLCSEVHLFHDQDHTYCCVLSSLNAEKVDEWFFNKLPFHPNISLPQLGIYFLDAVNQEYIDKGSKIPGLENSVRSAIKGRPLGLGVLGLHGFYMSRGWAFHCKEARRFNRVLFKHMKSEAWKASQTLADAFGEPEWLKGYGFRNTHCLSVAPTTTNSVLCNATSPGIEPIIANYYSFAGSKGTFIRKNPYLEKVLIKKNKNHGSVWASIREHHGSVQQLSFLSDQEKEVFRTAFEIDQKEILFQAKERQAFICQGQSLNLFIRSKSDVKDIIYLHLLAEEYRLKCLYYVRSDSELEELLGGQQIEYVFMRTRDDCIYCQKAKDLLEERGIFYVAENKSQGKVPEIWVDGELLDDGYNSLIKLLDAKSNSLVSLATPDCDSCDG